MKNYITKLSFEIYLRMVMMVKYHNCEIIDLDIPKYTEVKIPIRRKRSIQITKA